jgi:hypothetical protein
MRRLRLTSPPMRGARELQRVINRHLDAWHCPKTMHVVEDDVYGSQTYHRVHEVCFGLGIGQRALNHGVTPYVMDLLKHPGHLNKGQQARQHARASWRHRYAQRGKLHGVDAGVAFALAMSRKKIKESPPGSNSGPYITQWERLAGYNFPVPWCGCFDNACLVAAGLPTQSAWAIGFVPAIEAHAQARIDGWRWTHDTPRKGWLATFGRVIADHTEYVVADGWPLRTVGGNTSAGDGSPNNGGQVAYHDFSKYQGLPLRGFAVPNYHH